MPGTRRERRRGVWELRVHVGQDPKTGKYRQISKTFYGSARGADDALRDLLEKYRHGRPDGIGASLSDVLDRWIEECERVGLSPTTVRNYRSRTERTIRPALGKIQLARLRARHLDDLYGQLKSEGRAPKTIRNTHAIIAAALHQAVRWEWITDNVADRARPPRITQRRVLAPSVADVRAVIEAAAKRDPRIAPLLMTAALTGMRRGELCALRWSDIDWDRGEVHVTRSVITVPGGLAVKTPKTDRERTVALDDVGVAVLRRHLTALKGWASQVGVGLNGDSYVFSPYIDGAKPFRPDNVTNFFIRVRDELGLPSIRLHDLRHFTATQLIGAGVDVRTVAGRLGHSDPSLTLRVYSHAIEERSRSAAAIMGRVLGERSADNLDTRPSSEAPLVLGSKIPTANDP